MADVMNLFLNERMVVVEIDCLPRPICLINCYMPTFGYPDTSEKFQDNLDLLEQEFSRLRY
jgi:hypothetical protein